MCQNLQAQSGLLDTKLGFWSGKLENSPGENIDMFAGFIISAGKYNSVHNN